MPDKPSNVQAILTMVALVPAGRVATYGQIARLAGIPRNSRQVGSVMRTLANDSGVPWFRIVNASGEISQRGKPDAQSCQRAMLESEGVEFNSKGRVALSIFGWKPDTAQST